MSPQQWPLRPFFFPPFCWAVGSSFLLFLIPLFGFLDHFVWASFFRIWVGEHIAQMGFLCVWLGLEESFFLPQLLCFSCSHCLQLAWFFPRIWGVAVRLSDQFYVAHKFLPWIMARCVFDGCCLICWKLFVWQLLSLSYAQERWKFIRFWTQWVDVH